jgi:hypothetical protein
MSADSPPIEYGLCMCGCGQQTAISNQTRPEYGWVKGHPKRYILGHATRLSPVEYIEQDCGYATPCWVWQRAKRREGYGIVTSETGVSVNAHVLYYERAKGQRPAGMQIDHLCRNRACVNPDHLEAVTPAENAQRGAAAKLTPEKVRDIRKSKASIVSLTKKYGVSQTTIYNVMRGRTWVGVI